MGVVIVGAMFTIPDSNNDAREVDRNIRTRIEAGRGPFTLIIPDHWENPPKLGFNNIYKVRYHSNPNMTCIVHVGKTLDTVTVTCPNDNPLA